MNLISQDDHYAAGAWAACCLLAMYITVRCHVVSKQVIKSCKEPIQLFT